MNYLIMLQLILLFSSSQNIASHEGQSVRIQSHDGFILNAVYYTGGMPGPGILLLHQCDREESAPTGYENLASMLANKRFHVLMLDFRAYGKSTSEEFMRKDWKKAHGHFGEDVEAAYNFLTAQSGVDKTQTGVAGASCGAREAIMLAARHAEVKTLVFLSGAIMGESASEYQKLTHLPVLCIVSEGDRYGSGTVQSMKDAFSQSKNENSRLLLFKGPNHGTPLFAQDSHLETTIVEWFRAHLE